jgi:hypothetical protein
MTRVSFTTANGKRVSFVTKKKQKSAPHKKPVMATIQKRRKYSSPKRPAGTTLRARRIRKHGEELAKATLGYANPVFPVILAAGQLAKDLLE